MAGGSAASLSAVVSRLERALAAALGRDVGSAAALGAPLDIEHLTGRLEQLVTFLPNAGHHEQAADAPASKPVMLAPAVVATAAAPAAAAAAPAPVDNSAAEKAAAEKAAAEKAAAEKAKADAAAAEKAKADAAAAEKAKADAAAKAAADEKAKADAAAAAAAASKPAAAPVAAAASAPGGATVPASSSAASAVAGALSGPTYSYEQLKGTKIDGVNWAEREQRLSDEEFAAVFKMARPEFVRAAQSSAVHTCGHARRRMPRPRVRSAGGARHAGHGQRLTLHRFAFGCCSLSDYRTRWPAGSARRRRRPSDCSKRKRSRFALSRKLACAAAAAGLLLSPCAADPPLLTLSQRCPSSSISHMRPFQFSFSCVCRRKNCGGAGGVCSNDRS